MPVGITPKPLENLASITRCVMIQDDRRISRPGNRAHLARSVQPPPAARRSVHRATEAADAEQCQDAARSRRAAEQSVGGPEGDRAGQHSIRINRQWRICFVWTTGGPDRVEIVDYHQANSQPHPGEVLLLEFIEPMGLTQNGLARAIELPPLRINEIVLGKRSITADTDLRLARYFAVSEGF